MAEENYGPQNVRLNDFNAVHILSNMTRESPGLADATSTGQVKTTSAVDYLVNGNIHSLSATDDLWDLSGLTDLASGEYCKVLLTVDDSQNPGVYKGHVTASQGEAPLPEPPVGEAAIGYVEVAGSNDFDGESVSTSGTYVEGYKLA